MRVSEVRSDFPSLGREVHGRPLVYLDNAASAQMPKCVADAMVEHMLCHHSNIHRGTHMLGAEATQAYEEARAKVASFLRAPRESNCIFTSGTTASINMVARGIAGFLKPGKALLVTDLEHHSNYLPWQQLALECGAELRVCGLDENGEVDAEQWHRLLKDGQVVLAAVTAASNVTGGVTNLAPLVQSAKQSGAFVLVDGAQAARCGLLNTSLLGCDFIAISGHKMCAPTGIGVLWGRNDALERLAPSAFGGGMVDDVVFMDTSLSALPARLEAGTPNICGAVALGRACDYLELLGLEELHKREKELTSLVCGLLQSVPGVRVLGAPAERCGVLSFECDDISGYDIACMMDAQGVAVRSGHHCALPAMRALGVANAVRVSPAFYNTEAELVACAKALEKALQILGGH